MESDLQISGLRGRLADAEAQLARNNKVLAEVVDKYVRFKKNGAAVGGAGATRGRGGLRRALVAAVVTIVVASTRLLNSSLPGGDDRPQGLRDSCGMGSGARC